MKSKKLMAVLSVALLFAAGSVSAEIDAKENINYQNLSKRPYQQVPVESKNNKDDFEGATLIDPEAESDKMHQPIRLHMLGKRPFHKEDSE